MVPRDVDVVGLDKPGESIGLTATFDGIGTHSDAYSESTSNILHLKAPFFFFLRSPVADPITRHTVLR